MKIKTLIVDDELIALNHLELNILKLSPNIDIIAKVQTEADALSVIFEHRPDLVFLDIQLAGSNSFDLLNKIDDKFFEIIFVTAHDEFALKAIKNSAIDYILKPIDKIELAKAIYKAEQRIFSKNESVTTLSAGSKDHQIIPIPSMDGINFIPAKDILFLEANGRYTIIHAEDQKYTVSKSLGEYELLLDEHSFIRIHNHYIVNIHAIAKYIKGRGGYVILKTGQHLEVSTRKKDDFLDKLGG